VARPAASSALYHPLDHILGSPALVRVTRVLAGHGGSLGVSDIARRARLALPSTRNALRRLRETEVVTAVGAGRSMVCALRPEHPLAQPLAALYAAEREQAHAVLDAIRQAAAALRPEPLGVWLYGSVARGEDAPSSDVDIAVASGEADPTFQADALREAVAAAVPEQAHRISVVAIGPADVRRLAGESAGFWRDLDRDAVVLAGDAPAGVLERLAQRDVGS
jgi:predicted nucleotidyltransferase